VQRLAGWALEAQCVVEVAENLPLTDVAVRLSVCRFFIGHDSGITHLAAAVGLPGLVLWGESVEAVWRPRSERMHVLRPRTNLAELEVLEVLTALRELLPAP
jgi:ADP-heptose:LPS heptosyltransferase